MKKAKPSITKNSFSVQKKANGSTFFSVKTKIVPSFQPSLKRKKNVTARKKGRQIKCLN